MEPFINLISPPGTFEAVNTRGGSVLATNQFWEAYRDCVASLGRIRLPRFLGIHGLQWFQGKWFPHQTLISKGISIAWQELYAIVVSCAIWAPLWTRKRILFHCDNSAVVSIVNTKRSKCGRVMSLVRKLTLFTLQYNFYFKAVHIPGVKNEIADSLSRFQEGRFRNLAPWADTQALPIPACISSLWTQSCTNMWICPWLTTQKKLIWRGRTNI